MLALLFIIISLGAVFEIASLRRDVNKVEFDYTISTSLTEPGVPFNVQLAVTNESRLPISYLVIWEVFPMAAELPEGITYQMKNDGLYVKNISRVRGRQRKKLIFETSIKKRGVHLFIGDSIEFGDFLGFREITKKFSQRREVVVYPERIECQELTDALGNFCGDIAAKRFLIRDPILTIGCREYTGREPLKEIHWLQSAHRGTLMVREFDYNRQLSACVILSVDGIDSAGESELDECCSTARTVCETLAASGVSVNFFTNANLWRKYEKTIWKCTVSQNHTEGLLEGLGRVSSYACCSLEKLQEYALRENTSDTAFIIILPAGEKRGEELSNQLRRKTGQEVLLLQTGQTAREEEIA